MNQHCTIVYTTNRKDNKFDWFADSLCNQIETGDIIRVIRVDLHAERLSREVKFNGVSGIEFITTPPKPNVWNGKYRLTSQDYFAAASARNTGLCLAPDGQICYVDDLSVLLPTWLKSVRESMFGNYAVFGAYKKVKDLVVEKGIVKSFSEFHQGIDSRWNQVRQDLTSVGGSWLFGCSVSMPVNSLLDVNGWDEACDSCGSEDYCTGIRIGNLNKYSFIYDRRMLTYESEEMHGVESPMKRIDKGKSPNDKSHSLLRRAESSSFSPNYFGEGGIRALRDKILVGEDFPITQIPEHDFWDGQPLREM